MAHYAKLDENNKVLEICTIDNENCLLNGIEDEETGNYKYEGESSPNDLYEEEEDEDE